MSENMVQPNTLSFPQHARRVVQTMRGAFADLLSSLGADPHAPQDLSRKLGLNKNLAWKISKIIQADDAGLALQQMPRSAGIKILFRSLEKAGAPADPLRAAREAVEEYEQLIEVHAGDRTTLEILGSELSSNGRQQRDEQYRKQLFTGASYVWGAQARVVLKVGLVGPTDRDGLFACAFLTGLIDFRCLRPDVSWPVAARRAVNDDGTAFPGHLPQAIDPRHAGPNQPPFLEEFCSQPLPELREIRDAESIGYELVEGPVGNTGLRTCVFGTIHRGVPYYRTPENEYGSHSAACDTPAELLITDLFVHEQFDFAIPPQLNLVSGMSQLLRNRRETLPLNEPLQDLGPDPLLVATPEVPRYRQMVRTMFESTGWTPTEFRGFRIKIPYPPCPSTVRLFYKLPARP